MTSQAPDHIEEKTSSDAGSAQRRNRRRNAYLLTEQDEPLLAQLPDKYVEILRQEGSIADIASRLNIARGTVKSRTHRARVALDALRAQSRQNEDVRH
jgi:DNA-directed RNA polymerase specialized sigma24 family protein